MTNLKKMTIFFKMRHPWRSSFKMVGLNLVPRSSRSTPDGWEDLGARLGGSRSCHSRRFSVSNKMALKIKQNFYAALELQQKQYATCRWPCRSTDSPNRSGPYPSCLSFKTSLGAKVKPFKWKWIWFAWKKTRNRAKRQLGNSLLRSRYLARHATLSSPTSVVTQRSPPPLVSSRNALDEPNNGCVGD